MGWGYEDLVFFCRNNGWINGKHGQGTHCTKMGAVSLAENTPNDPEFIWPICQDCLDIDEKRLHWASVVRGQIIVA